MPVMQPHGPRASADGGRATSAAADATTDELRRHVGNLVSGYFVELPCDLPSAAARLAAVQAQTAPKRRWRVAPFHSLLIRAALPLVPRVALPLLVRDVATALSCPGVSCFRGPADGAILGLDVRAFYYYGFFEPARMPLMLGISSVADRLVVSLVSTCDALGGGGAPALLRRLPAELCRIEAAVRGAEK
eukprot:1098922-Prymnesium_polylepis.1